MRISECMSPDPRIVNPEETVCDAAKIMSEIDAGVLPVGDHDRLVGMITDRDIAIRAVAAGLGPRTKVGDVMSREVLYCYADEDIDDVLENMGDVKVRRLPVLDRNKRLVGIVSIGDLASNGATFHAGEALGSISKPGGEHSQSTH